MARRTSQQQTTDAFPSLRPSPTHPPIKRRCSIIDARGRWWPASQNQRKHASTTPPEPGWPMPASLAAAGGCPSSFPPRCQIRVRDGPGCWVSGLWPAWPSVVGRLPHGPFPFWTLGTRPHTMSRCAQGMAGEALTTETCKVWLASLVLGGGCGVVPWTRCRAAVGVSPRKGRGMCGCVAERRLALSLFRSSAATMCSQYCPAKHAAGQKQAES